MLKTPFYITTPIYYPSGNPHIGHCYTTVACDAAARYRRMQGYEVLFLTGTDEHGLKIEQKAKAAGMEPQGYVDGMTQHFRKLWEVLNVRYDRFVRTTDDYHIHTVTGVRAFEDPEGHWVRTRRIWNQHSYHVTNINEDGTVPKHEVANWLVYNNYRQNVQPEGVFNAPNFVPGKLEYKLIECSNVEFTANVKNEGSYGVKPGLKVHFYIVNPNGREGHFLIGEAETTSALSPGAETTVSFVWNRKVKIGESEEVFVDTSTKVYFYIDKPDTETPNGDYAECVEDDNQSEMVDVRGCADS